jgi:hypothetical protein
MTQDVAVKRGEQSKAQATEAGHAGAISLRCFYVHNPASLSGRLMR